MEATSTLIIILLALWLGGYSPPKPPPPPPKPPVMHVCHFTQGRLELEMDSPFRKNTQHVTRIQFRGKTPYEAEKEVINAYYWWAENVGPDSTHWFVREARKQHVHITLDYGGRYPTPKSVWIDYPCR